MSIGTLVNRHIATLVLLLLPVATRITISEPRALRVRYLAEQIKYSIMNFGRIPYGQTVSGEVVHANPADGCAPLAPLARGATGGTQIVLMERGNCNFAEKVLNAQQAGAKLALVTDNNSENVHTIFPVERTKSTLDKVHIPSILVSKYDGDNIKIAMDMHDITNPAEGYKHPVELAVHFDLQKSNHPTILRFILQVDDPQSYELVRDFADNYRNFRSIIDLHVHFKLFMNPDLPFKTDECLMSGLDTYCISRNPADPRDVPGLISETIRQMCLNNHDFWRFASYSSSVRKQCFQVDGLPTSTFQDCTNTLFNEMTTLEERESMSECMKFGSAENEILLLNNHEETKYFLINYSPLIFINGFYYKSNFDDISHLFETICNSFESTPEVCRNLEAFIVADDTNYMHLLTFMAVALGASLVLTFGSIIVFYIIYKRKLRRQLVSELNERITKALMNHKENSDRSSCKRLDERSPVKSRVSGQ